MELVKPTMKNIKEIIRSNYNIFFSKKTLRNDFNKKYQINRIETYEHEQTQRLIRYQIGHILGKLQKYGIIEKYSKNSFKIVQKR